MFSCSTACNLLRNNHPTVASPWRSFYPTTTGCISTSLSSPCGWSRAIRSTLQHFGSTRNFSGSPQYLSFNDATFFTIFYTLVPGRYLLPFSLLNPTFQKNSESSLHFCPLTLQGETPNTFNCSNCADNVTGFTFVG